MEPEPDPELTARFLADWEALAGAAHGRIGLAVSGGPDSLALLLLARAALPGRIEVATVDHGLRAGSAGEARDVALLCARLGVPHAVLSVEVAPGNMQAQARRARYRALGGWAGRRGLGALATAHHADDQAETLLMRLNRGSGLAGLAGVRGIGRPAGIARPVLRPLLAWRKAELEAVVRAAGIEAARDPANTDPAFDRARLRAALAQADWLDPAALAASAAHLADALDALEWAVEREWEGRVRQKRGGFAYIPQAPAAIRLEIAARIVARLGGEPRKSDVARAVARLETGEPASLAGVLARPDEGTWHFAPEPPRGSG